MLFINIVMNYANTFYLILRFNMNMADNV